MQHSPRLRKEVLTDLPGSVCDDIKASLRASVINLPFRLWAKNPQLLDLLWAGLKPNAQSRFAEAAADRLRKRAVKLVSTYFGTEPWDWKSEDELISPLTLEMARYVVNIHHYLDPKLLMVSSILAETVLCRSFRPVTDPAAKVSVPRGIPTNMPQMHLSQGQESRSQTRAIFDEIQWAMKLPQMSSDYLYLSLCPGVLDKSWKELQPMVVEETYWIMADRLLSLSARLARKAPFPVDIRWELIHDAWSSRAEAVNWIMQTHAALSRLVLNMAALKIGLDGKEDALRSPYPVV